MRIYNIANRYIDLDHVLCVNELFLDFDPVAWAFSITLMFLDKPVYVRLWPPNDAPIEAEDYKPEAEITYKKFIEAWGNKTKEDKTKVQTSSGSGFVSNGVKLVHNGKYLYLTDSGGKVFRNQISCTIKDYVNKPTIAIIKAHVQSIEYRENV